MRLYLSAEDLSKAARDDQTGEQRGGKYAARVQIGVEKDGSPRYRYFKTVDEYKTYLEHKGRPGSKKKKKEGDLETKVKKEQAKGGKKRKKEAKRAQQALLVGGAKKKDSPKKVSKSLYIGSTEE